MKTTVCAIVLGLSTVSGAYAGSQVVCGTYSASSVSNATSQALSSLNSQIPSDPRAKVSAPTVSTQLVGTFATQVTVCVTVTNP